MDPVMYDAQKKSTLVSFLLWFFLGTFGGHRFYFGKIKSAIGLIVLGVFSWSMLFAGLAAAANLQEESAVSMLGMANLGFVAYGIWLLVDLIMMFGWVKKHNVALAQQ